MTLVSLLLLLLPLVAACGSGTTSGSAGPSASKASEAPTVLAASVTGVRWSVDSLTVAGEHSVAPDEALLEIAEDGEVNGTLGCNDFHATAEMTPGTLEFTDWGLTEMACAKDVMAFEDSLRDTLTEGRLKPRVDGGELTLTTEGGDTVRLGKAKQAQLLGVTWTVDALVDDNTATSLPSGTLGKVWFTIDKRTSSFTGTLGCNRVTARATVGDGHLTLTRLGSTRRTCSGEVMKTERALKELLQKKLAYEVGPDNLTLTAEDGRELGAIAPEPQ
ncbi:META domain-containing protein [Streptomyces phaeolivaceus]|nr:META domain-containing protein [Streptomyces phaeolivaceus]